MESPSSPLSSVASRSPSPPVDYPTPPSSNISDTSSQPRSLPTSLPGSDGPPAKKRKMLPKEPTELKTDYLDLRILNNCSDETIQNSEYQKLERLMEVLRSKRKIVIIAGAGISVSAGIPDFRSSTGLFATLRNQHNLKSSGKHLFDASVYRNDSSTSSFHDMVRELSHLTQNAQPTLFHHMIATLAEEGRLLRLYTQNVDGIDTSLEPLATKVPLNVKGPWPKTIQLHGGLEKMVCSKCGDLSDFNGALFEGPEPPSCPRCEEIDDTRRVVGLRSHGIGRLRPRMVLYNEFNPDEEAIGAVSASDLAKRPDAVIVVGTSLKVPGIRRLAKEMCAVTRGRRGGFTAWINHDPEPVGVEFKDCWELVVRGECDDVSRHVDLPRWFDKDVGEFSIVTSEEDKAKKGLVGLEIRPLEFVKAQAMPTPGASPREQSPSAMDTKLKQAQLPFTVNGVFGQKAQKVRKKPGRKPKHPLAATSKITKAFNTSKGTKATKSKPTPLELFPNLPQEPSAMRQVSPVDHRINSEMVWHENCIDKVKSGPPRPVTPIRETKEYDREETISPKGRVPFGMEKLIS